MGGPRRVRCTRILRLACVKIIALGCMARLLVNVIWDASVGMLQATRSSNSSAVGRRTSSSTEMTGPRRQDRALGA